MRLCEKSLLTFFTSISLFAAVSYGSFLFNPSVSWAQSAELSKTEVELAGLRKEITKKENLLRKIVKKEAEIKESVKGLKSLIDQLRADEQKLMAEINAFEVERGKVQDSLNDFTKQLEEKKQVFNKRLKAIYMVRRRLGVMDFLADSRSSRDLLRRARAMRLIAENDDQKLSELETLSEKLKEKEKQLKTYAEVREVKLQILEGKQKKIRERQTNLDRDLDLLADKTAEVKEQMDTLYQSAMKLELVIAAFTGATTSDLAELKAALQAKKPLPKTNLNDLSISVDAMRKSLPWPIQGEIVKPYGKREVAGFQDIVFNKGIEMEARGGAIVKAVADGTVVYNKKLPGIGLVVILDHGQRFFSLYGKLFDVFVNVDDLLIGGDSLGLLTDEASGGAEFYFEIRYRGKAVDPKEFLKGT